MDQNNKNLESFSHKSPYLYSFFSNDSAFMFMVKKTEKLASAIYLITNLFGDNEPMKWQLRGKVSETLSFILGYKNTPNSVFSEFIKELEFEIFEILSLLEVSLNGGLISTMNFNIIKQEFINLLDIASSQKNAKELSGISLSKNFFDSGLGDVKLPINNDDVSGISTENKITTSSLKDTNSDKISHDFKKSSRQNVILSLIKRKKEVTIKDISLVIKNCSEKTIQRELITFISAGIIKRIGERRWSKYSLA